MGCGHIFVSACTEGSFVGTPTLSHAASEVVGTPAEHVTQFHCRAWVIIHLTSFTESSVTVKDIDVILGVMSIFWYNFFDVSESLVASLFRLEEYHTGSIESWLTLEKLLNWVGLRGGNSCFTRRPVLTLSTGDTIYRDGNWWQEIRLTAILLRPSL